MPFVLIPLVISLLSAGAAIVNQVQENNRLNSEGQQAVVDALKKNETERANEYNQYVSTIDRINEQQIQSDWQTQTDQARRSRLTTVILLSTAILMAGLTLHFAAQRKQM